MTGPARLRAWGAAAAWAALIFWLSSRPSIPAPAIPGLDKVAHLAAYAVLGFLLARAAPGSLAAVALGLLYGASDEIHQTYVPGRTADPLDWVADAAGVLLGTWAHTLWRARRAPRAAVPHDGT